MPCILFIPLPTARRPYWRQGGWPVDICERNEGEMSPPRPVPWPSVSAQAEQGGQASPPRPGAGSITGTRLLKGEATLRRCLLTFPQSHSEVGWPCSGNTRGRNVKQVVEALAVTKAVWATDLTEEVTQQRMQACRHAEQEGRAPRLEPVPRQLWELGFHQEDVWTKDFCQPPRGPSRGTPRASGPFCWPESGRLHPKCQCLAPHILRRHFTLFLSLSCSRQHVSVSLSTPRHRVSIRQSRSVAFSTTTSKIFLLFHLQR